MDIQDKIRSRWNLNQFNDIRDGVLILIDLFEGLSTHNKLEIRNALSKDLKITYVIDKMSVALLEDEPICCIFCEVTKIIDNCNNYVAGELGLNDLNGPDGITYLCAPFLGNVLFNAEVDIEPGKPEDDRMMIWARKCDLHEFKELNNVLELENVSVFIKSYIKAIFYIYMSVYTLKNISLYYSAVKGLYPQLRDEDMEKPFTDLPGKVFTHTSDLTPIARKFLLDSQFINNRLANLMLNYISDCKPDDPALDPAIVYVADLVAVNKNLLGENTNVATYRSDTFANIAVARILSGKIKVGDNLFIHYPKYLPKDNNECRDKCQLVQNVNITQLYMFVGNSLLPTNSVPAGNICGIAGLERHMILGSNATLCSHPLVAALKQHHNLELVVWNSLNCRRPYRQNLDEFLEQADCPVQVKYLKDDKIALLSAGRDHLYSCLEQLQLYVPIRGLEASPVSVICFKETIIPQNNINHYNEIQPTSFVDYKNGFKLSVIAVPLPNEIIDCIKTYIDLLKCLEKYNLSQTKDSLTYDKVYEIENVMQRFEEELEDKFNVSFWQGFWKKIWSIDSDGGNINILFNNTDDFDRNIFKTTVEYSDQRIAVECLIFWAFQNCCRKGPICGRPLTNCAFIVQKYEIIEDNAITQSFSNSVNYLNTMENCFLRSLKREQLRLMEPIYSADITVHLEDYEKVKSVLNGYKFKVIQSLRDDEDMVMKILLEIPVDNSEGFAVGIRGATAGDVLPQLNFSHYAIIDGDPWYETENEEEASQHMEDLRASRCRRDTCLENGIRFVTTECDIITEEDLTDCGFNNY